ncbi:MAG: YcxB family protein [Akkermansiaceae bacterium]|nr:YcxB family protein [Akkermansiaceae bacterium]
MSVDFNAQQPSRRVGKLARVKWLHDPGVSYFACGAGVQAGRVRASVFERSMKDIVITVLFVVVFLGGMIFLAILPVMIRRLVLRSNRKARHRRFEEAVERWKESDKEQVFDVSVRLYKEDVLQLVALDQRLHFPWYGRLLGTLFFGWWVIGGSLIAWRMISGQEAHRFLGWLQAVIGVLVGLRFLWLIWVQWWIIKKNVESTSDMQISEGTATDYKISPEGIRIIVDGQELATPEWSEVDRFVEEPNALRIMSKANDVIWIPKESLFHQGDWEGLRDFLSPFKKGAREV